MPHCTIGLRPVLQDLPGLDLPHLPLAAPAGHLSSQLRALRTQTLATDLHVSVVVHHRGVLIADLFLLQAARLRSSEACAGQASQSRAVSFRATIAAPENRFSECHLQKRGRLHLASACWSPCRFLRQSQRKARERQVAVCIHIEHRPPETRLLSAHPLRSNSPTGHA